MRRFATSASKILDGAGRPPSPPAGPESRPRTSATTALWLALGVVSAAVGAVGIAVPLLPTTPFLLVAAFSFSKSSPRLSVWLDDHPLLGPPVRDWRAAGAISTGAKAVAFGAMLTSLLAAYGVGLSTPALVVQAMVLAIAALFVATRPGRRRS